MLKSLRRQPILTLFLGLFAGIAIAVSTMYGVSTMTTASSKNSTIPAQWLHADSAATGDGFALATGKIDENDGLFTLDFTTGELNLWVVNTRAGGFPAHYTHNVLADLGVERGKAAKFVMVTGAAQFRSGGGGVAPAASILYVADAGTGNVVAYSIPWSRALDSSGRPQGGTLSPIGKFKARNLLIPE